MEVAKQQRAFLGGELSLPSDEFEPDPRYRALLDWIWSFSARPRSPHEMALQRAVKLERMYAMLAALGHPQLRFPSILVAGTKGKGSTVAMLGACLMSAGYRTGRYTSPHLVNWRERTAINDDPISTSQALALADAVRESVEGLPRSLGIPTTFEVGTALSFLYFARQEIDLAVVEVGTGGRFDATNLVEAMVSVVAPVSYDHTQTLGATLTSIAWHKAGILRWGRPVVSAPQAEEARAVIRGEARLLRAPLEEVGHEWTWSSDGSATRIVSTRADFLPLSVGISLLGNHQRDNATSAVAALHALRERFPLSREAIAAGLKNVVWPGRLQLLADQPLVVLDGAHNAASAEVLRRALEQELVFDRVILVLGLTEGKDALGVVGALSPRADVVYLTRSRHERAAAPAQLAPLVEAASPNARVLVAPEAPSAFQSALAAAQPRDLVLVTGSLFLVGEALDWWRQSHR